MQRQRSYIYCSRVYNVFINWYHLLRIVYGPGARCLWHQAAFHDVRRVHDTGQQHHRVSSVRILAVGRARLVRG